MAEASNIEWTDSTVNFWWGCTKVGLGCDHCYAETWSKRTGGNIWGTGVPRRKIKSAVTLLDRLHDSYRWIGDSPHRANGWRVFIQSMSDLFDLEVPLEWFAEAWQTIERCDGLHIQIVTKRISAVEKRLSAIGGTSWPKHAGLMITVCNQAEADRDIPRLLARKKQFGIPWCGLSIEPMLGQIIIPPEWLAEIDWIIVGGESGPGARPMHPDWARSLRDQCAAADVPFFFKQWGNWAPWLDRDRDDPDWRADYSRTYAEGHGIKWLNAAGGSGFHGERLHVMAAGKKSQTGRSLDGIEHNNMPRAFS